MNAVCPHPQLSSAPSARPNSNTRCVVPNKYLYINEIGDAVVVTQQPGEDSLTCLQTLVNGLIELVRPNKLNCDVWCNEEALFQPNFGINLVASFMTGRQLVGPIVLTSSNANGDTTSFPQHLMDKLKREGLIIDTGNYSSADIVRLYPSTYPEGTNESNSTVS